MIDNELLAILRCPISGSTLEIASPDIADKLTKTSGLTIKEAELFLVTVESGTDGNQLAYPVVNGIPKLLAQEAIKLSQ